ncbi:hypothetical protein N0V84_010106 [Fusarium piperis]|uniref:Beta-xylosidase C-terminal Concanavalin A-like domain-containing protein n=1 Tax=Fusarium piperis TaxID=1435070 RepID=A0A9W9BH04_9HYPO|nr:hypothetical protein N0V84_010106 [Fusarium piperis]
MKLVEYRNPIVPGFSPDPSVVFVDGVFYLANSSFHVFPGIPIYASRDLKTWTHIGNAINHLEQLSLDGASTAKMPLDTGHFMYASGGLFAPTIRHHQGKFYVICTNFLAFESDPVYIPFYGIDPSLFFEDDGRVYFQGCYTIGNRMKQPTCTIKQFEIGLETGKQLSEEREIWEGRAKYDTEGPHIYKIGKPESIWGPYEDYAANPIMTADGKDEYIQNLGHGELFQDGEGRWWVSGLGVRNDNEGEPLGKDNFVAPLGRESFLAPVEWTESGWPKITQPTMKFLARPVKVPEGLPEIVAPRDVSNLYIRTPDLSKYRVPEDDASQWVLYPSRANLSTPTGTPTFVGRRQMSLNSVSTATLDISKLEKGVEAGLALYKDHRRHVSIIYNSDSRKITCRDVSMDIDNVLLGEASVKTGAFQVQFRIVADPKKWTFFTRGSEQEWTQVGTLEAWKFVAREMTGPMFGVFAHALSEHGESVAVSFSEFTVDDVRD